MPGIQRKVASTAAALVAETDRVTVMPRSCALVMAERLPLHVGRPALHLRRSLEAHAFPVRAATSAAAITVSVGARATARSR